MYWALILSQEASVSPVQGICAKVSLPFPPMTLGSVRFLATSTIYEKPPPDITIVLRFACPDISHRFWSPSSRTAKRRLPANTSVRRRFNFQRHPYIGPNSAGLVSFTVRADGTVAEIGNDLIGTVDSGGTITWQTPNDLDFTTGTISAKHPDLQLLGNEQRPDHHEKRGGETVRCAISRRGNVCRTG